MPEITRMLEHYDGVLSGEPWHGDPIWQILGGIPAEVAAARPWDGSHTIWEIVMHMTFWEGVATERLAGQRAGLAEELNFPAMPVVSEENWKQTLDQFRASNQKFRAALAKLDPARLDELTAAGKRTYYGEVHGVIEHTVYHAGQIALLKK
ncbi:MAG: DinB family protein [Candidatus Korobacteraceae bacterium]